MVSAFGISHFCLSRASHEQQSIGFLLFIIVFIYYIHRNQLHDNRNLMKEKTWLAIRTSTMVNGFHFSTKVGTRLIYYTLLNCTELYIEQYESHESPNQCNNDIWHFHCDICSCIQKITDESATCIYCCFSPKAVCVCARERAWLHGKCKIENKFYRM